MIASYVLSLEHNDLEPQGQLSLSGMLLVTLAVCLVSAIGLVVLTMMLSRPKTRSRHPKTKIGAHTDGGKSSWQSRIDQIVEDYHRGTLERDEAFIKLAKVARDYASFAMGANMGSHTLNDLRAEQRTGSARHGLDLLRTTIAALYPPEFADASVNALAKETSVDQAGEWVSRLVERWRQ
jgi:hypothetical protein